MRITKFGHSCVRIEHDGTVLVIDPGGFTEREALDGATAVLVTHEHPDHLDLDHLRGTDAPVFTVGAVARQIEAAPEVRERVTVVTPGGSFDAGLPVQAVGELHAVLHDDVPRIANSGFLVRAGDATVYHPGDSFTEPGEPVDVLLTPVSAPWLKLAEAVDFARAVGAPRNVGIHDKVSSAAGIRIVDTRMAELLGARGLGYERPDDGSDMSS